PQVTNYEAGGDNSWRNSFRLYNVDFQDDTSKLKDGSYRITSSTGGVLKDWTLIFQSTNVVSYAQNWGVDWNSLKEGTNYISVKLEDYAGNTEQENNIFFVKKDTTPPSIQDSQSGDDTWRTANSGTYNINFTDTGGSLLDKFQIKVTTGADFTGALVFDWADVITEIASASYSDDWQIPSAIFNAMEPGKNYVHVRAYDLAGSTQVLPNSFYVLKDTSLPAIGIHFSGDDTWRRSPGTKYDVDFEDYDSKLSTGYYRVKTSTGGVWKDWSVIFSSPGASSFTTDWELDFSGLKEGVNSIDVKVYDGIGNFYEASGLFHVKKDTTSPVLDDNQSGDDTWRYVNNVLYDI
ncbi:MAG TPA: hypothetical protein VJC03_03630, partial [bacterium]|nr:hypothetical protein [bacterium]